MIDLYPRDSWNFVFGQASLTDGNLFGIVCRNLVNLKILEDAEKGKKFHYDFDEGYLSSH